MGRPYRAHQAADPLFSRECREHALDHLFSLFSFFLSLSVALSDYLVLKTANLERWGVATAWTATLYRLSTGSCRGVLVQHLGVKAMMRKQRSMNSLLFETYLQEAMWRTKFDTPFCDAFQSIISHITQQYPCI